MPAPVGTAPAATEGSAIVALVCAVLSWIAIPVVLAVVALLVARSAERAIVSSGGLKSGLGLVSAAKWVAWINLLVCAMVVAFIAAFIVAVAIGR